MNEKKGAKSMDGRVLGPKLVAYMRIRAQGQEDTAADMALVRITSGDIIQTNRFMKSRIGR